MARPKKAEAPDLAQRLSLTAGAIERLTCPPGKQQAFLRDSEAPGLRVRVTAAGAKSYVYEAKLNRQTIRRTIGDVKLWTIEQARTEARRLAVLLDNGTDPRELDRQQEAERETQRQQEQAEVAKLTTTGLDAWEVYVEEGRTIGFTRRGKWGDRHYQDHLDLADAGGKDMKRGKGKTAPGPLHGLLSKPLAQIDDKAVAAWLKAESAARPARAALGFRLLRGFLNWCVGHEVYGAIAKGEAHKPKEVRRLVRLPTTKIDALQREQLGAWFKAVREDSNRIASVYLQTLLLTGARKGEIAGLRWEDVDLRFGGSMTIRDKVEGLRVIPCPAYIAHLLATLPRRSQWVFGADDEEAPKVAHNATYNHRRALAAAGLPHVSLHGLRRSFGSLSEWVECPAGVVAQLQGHKPSATAEKHYRVRPLDLLRMWHDKIEEWVLAQAGIQFDRKIELGKLRVVAAA